MVGGCMGDPVGPEVNISDFGGLRVEQVRGRRGMRSGMDGCSGKFQPWGSPA